MEAIHITNEKEIEFSKIDRILHRSPKQMKKKDEGHKFIQLKMSWDQALTVRETVEKSVSEDPFLKNLKIRNFIREEDAAGFVTIYNRAFITAPDPYRSLTLDQVKHFKEDSTFICMLYGKMIGFLVLTIEPLVKGGLTVGKSGIIAGIGVSPRYRRRKIAMALVAYAAKFFDENNVDELVCEVYHENKVSYNFIKSFGMIPTGEIYL